MLETDSTATDEFVQRMDCVPRFARALNARWGAPLDEEEIIDLVQDTLTSMWRRLSTYEGRARLETWAFRFTDLGFRNAARRARRRVAAVAAMSEAEPTTGSHETPNAETRASVQELLDLLGEPDASLLRARFFDQDSIRGIAGRFGMKENTVKSRIHRALLRLRTELTEGAS